MTPLEAAACWEKLHADELAPRLVDARPKVKDFEAVILLDRARSTVKHDMASFKGYAEMRDAILPIFGKLVYRRGSRFNPPRKD